MFELKRANIMEVAERAEVSAMTVTRAFNGGAPVAEKTRDRIMRAAEELGYRPNPMARALRGAKTKSIGILCSMSGPHNSAVFLRKISLKAMEKSYVTYMADSLSNPEIICEALSDFLDRSVDGVICELSPSLSKDKKILEKLSLFPAKVIVSENKVEIKAHQLIRYRYDAVNDIVDCFVKNGRTKPVIISSPRANSDRIKVFIKRLQYHGINPLEKILIPRKKGAGKTVGDEFIKGLLEIYPSEITFDSVWCSCDEGAAAVMNYLMRKGISIPGDVAVIGSNDSEMCEYLNPPLASVRRFDGEAAEAAADMLFEQMENKKTVLKIKNYPMKFIWRKSAGKNF